MGFLCLGGLNACLLNIANFLVTAYTSAITLQILGNVKACVGIMISVFIFGNELRFMQGLGVIVCLFGVHIYEKKGGRVVIAPPDRDRAGMDIPRKEVNKEQKAPVEREELAAERCNDEVEAPDQTVQPTQIPPPKEHEHLNSETSDHDEN